MVTVEVEAVAIGVLLPIPVDEELAIGLDVDILGDMVGVIVLPVELHPAMVAMPARIRMTFALRFIQSPHFCFGKLAHRGSAYLRPNPQWVSVIVHPRRLATLSPDRWM